MERLFERKYVTIDRKGIPSSQLDCVYFLTMNRKMNILNQDMINQLT